MKVLFYHSHFFNRSETFIYHQAINPHIEAVLLAKGFPESKGLSNQSFSKIKFRRSWWDGLVSNLLLTFSIDRYYQNKSIVRLTELITSSHVDVLHAQFGFNAIRILPVAKKLRLPLVVSFHGLDASRMLRSRSYRNGLREVFNYASAVIVCNPDMAEVLPLTTEQKRKVQWIPYGIDLLKFNPSLRAENSTLRILHVGRLIEKKGVPDLIRAFVAIQTSQSIQLDIVGTGPEENSCREIVNQNNLQHKVIFHGWKSPEEVKHLMQECDVFVLNSRAASNGDSEGLPVGILEAMAMQLPVVSTYHAAIPRAVDHSVTGLLVKECDTKELTFALTELIENKDLREKMGRAARTKIESFFTLDQMHDKLTQIYHDVRL